MTRPIQPPWSMLHPARFAAARGSCVPDLMAHESVVRPGSARPAKPKRQASSTSSAQALAMLTRQSMHSAPVPRFHVDPRVVDGTLLVDDRASGAQFKVYTPRFVSQFRGGHRAGLWYLRPATEVGIEPQSLGFATAHHAVEALRTASWNLSASAAERRRAHCRVIWL